MFCAACVPACARMGFSHRKESDNENETVCSAGGVAVLTLGPRGHGGGLLQIICEVLPRKLLPVELRRERRELLPGWVLPIRQATGCRKESAGRSTRRPAL